MIGRKKYFYVLFFCLFLFTISFQNLNLKVLKAFYFLLINENEILSDSNYKYTNDLVFKREFQDFMKKNKKEINESSTDLFDSAYLRRIMNGKFCPLIPPNLVGEAKVDEENISFQDLNKKYENLFNDSSGGHWKPKHCQAFFKVAIVVPYRDREIHLKLFLNHMHKILPSQQIDYSIYIVEQVSSLLDYIKLS